MPLSRRSASCRSSICRARAFPASQVSGAPYPHVLVGAPPPGGLISPSRVRVPGRAIAVSLVFTLSIAARGGAFGVVARTACQPVAMPTKSAAAMALSSQATFCGPTGAVADGRRAGAPVRRSSSAASAASPLAIGKRRRSLSKPSSRSIGSPQTAARRCESLAGAAALASRPGELVSRVEGFGGSCSRMRQTPPVRPCGLVLVQRRRAGQEFVKQYAERVDVRAKCRCRAGRAWPVGAMYSNADTWPCRVKSVLSVRGSPMALATPSRSPKWACRRRAPPAR